MIKVLFFIDKLGYKGSFGGAEKVLITLVNHMDPEKFDITIQTLFPDKFAKLLNSNIHYKYCYPKKTSFFSYRFRIEAQLGWVYPLYIKDDYDLEIAYLEFDSTKVMAASTNKKAKKIAWIHCDFNTAIINKEDFIKKTSKLYTKYDKVVCVSNECKSSFVSMFGNNPEAVVVHNVIDSKEIIDKASQSLPYGIKKRKFTICMVGSLVQGRNHIRLLSTAYRLHEELFDFDLWIVGDGDQRPILEEYIKDHNMGSYVELLGFRSNPYPFVKTADLFAYSSNYEGFSTVVTEGIVLGKPILTTDCSGMHELLDDYDNGFIVENSDEAFYHGLKNLLTDFPKSNCVNQSFSTSKLVRENEELFVSVLLD